MLYCIKHNKLLILLYSHFCGVNISLSSHEDSIYINTNEISRRSYMNETTRRQEELKEEIIKRRIEEDIRRQQRKMAKKVIEPVIEPVKRKQKYNREHVKKYKKNNYKKIMLYRTKSRAIKKGWDFDLIEDDITIPDFCPVLHTPLIIDNEDRYSSPSIDRIDSSKGYTKDNIMIISWQANFIKNNMSKDQIKHLYNFYCIETNFDF